MKPLIALVSLLLPALAFAQSADCPLMLPQGSIEVPRPPVGWIGSSPTLAKLTGGGVMSGHPKLMQYLVPDETKKIKGGSRTTWRFQPGEEKWLYCTYGTQAVQIAKRMDDKASQCTVVWREEGGEVIGMTAVCK
jgi:hypothetical protein